MKNIFYWDQKGVKQIDKLGLISSGGNLNYKFKFLLWFYK